MSLPIPATTKAELAEVDRLIRERIQARPVVAQLVEQYESTSDHPRLRATLALLCGQLGRAAPEAARHAAAAVELIQIAMQIHGDLVEPGSAGAPHQWRGDATLMLGDYLLALAAVEMTLAPDQRVIACYSRAVMAICEGRLAPVTDLTPLELAVEQYYAHAGQTGAALVEAACKAGAVCGGLDDGQIEVLGRFGYLVGLAGQIAGDVRAALAVPRPSPRQRPAPITLPLIYAADADPALAALLQGHQRDNGRARDIAAAVEHSGAAERALSDAQQRARSAVALLDALPDSPARQALAALAHAVAQ